MLLRSPARRSGSRRNRIATLVAGVIALLATMPPALFGQGDSVRIPGYRARVLGVFDETTGEPLEGAEVLDVLNGNSSLTTKTGTVSLIFLPDGGSLVRVRKVGYEVQTFQVSISAQNVNPITVILSRVAQLGTVHSTAIAAGGQPPAFRGFDERRARGFGHFVTDSMLRKADEKKLSEVIIGHIPGVTVEYRNGAMYLSSQRVGTFGPSKCYSAIYFDGVAVTDRNLASYNVSDLGGIEYYQGGSTMPPEFNGTGSACGVLVLWSRAR